MTPDIGYSVEDFSDYEVVAVTKTGPYPLSAPAAWNALWDWVNEHDEVENVRRKIGFGLDDPRFTLPISLRYRACIVLHRQPDNLPATGPVEQQTVPGGAYAVHRMKGPYLAMPATFAFFRQQVLNDHEIDMHRPFQEIYLNDPTENPPEEWLTDLCIPLKA